MDALTRATEGRQLVAVFSASGFSLDFDPRPGSDTQTATPASEQELYARYLQDADDLLWQLAFLEPDSLWSPSLLYLSVVCRGFARCLARTVDIEHTREATVVAPTAQDLEMLLARTPFVLGAEFVDAGWIKGIFRRLTAVFAREISTYPGTVAAYLQAHDAGLTVFGRVFFHLVENRADSGYPFAFLATYSRAQPPLPDQAGPQGQAQGQAGAQGPRAQERTPHTPLQSALWEYRGQDELLLRLLTTVTTAAEGSKLISQLVESGELFSPLKFTSEEAYTFLQEVPFYQECGIYCRIPDWWTRRRNGPTLTVNVGERAPSLVGANALLDFEPRLYLGDEEITAEELRSLLAEAAGLALIKGKWVEVDPDKLAATLAAYERAQELAGAGGFSMAEAMRLQLRPEELLDIEADGVRPEVRSGRWLQEILSQLTDPMLVEDVEPGPGFTATLREYQQQGVNWLKLMQDLGLGACLADDMGLGKTVQVIALLEQMRTSTRGRSLLIIPASLMGNWQRELSRFAPGLSFRALYSSKDVFDPAAPDTDLVITTYGLVRRILELQKVEWELLILDEAQAIKNPHTKQTKAVKELQAKARIALTGTPIENRLLDLWSLFDFLNSGLLGPMGKFRQFGKGLQRNGDGYGRLRQVIAPFILRRLKTDKSIIADLPEKIELKAYTTLSKQQVVLYQRMADELARKLEHADGIGRKGLVLASIMKAKQICNHPAQYLGQPEFAPGHSGKFQRLQELCETIAEKRERVLVFTQFREMTGPLADFLASVFGREGLVLHGQTPVKQRGELVERFCGSEYIPFLILSLKAGGVGLNLTAANHVIHFDRWWNPAVENQATDRAFRIGQQKGVMVHKFVTAGTIEEKIDQMMEEKRKLAADILAGAGESWITELDNEEIKALFAFQA